MGDPSFLAIFASTSFLFFGCRHDANLWWPLLGGVALDFERIHQVSEELHLRCLIITISSQLFNQHGVIAVDGGGTGREIADNGLAHCRGLVVDGRLQCGELLLQSRSILQHDVLFGSIGACLCGGALVEGVGTFVPAPLIFGVGFLREYAVLFG